MKGSTCKLQLHVLDPVIFYAFMHLRPRWFPWPRLVNYENVDLKELRNDLVNWEKEDAGLFRVVHNLFLQTQDPLFLRINSWAELVDSFLDPTTKIELPLKARWPLGKMASSTSAQGKYELRLTIAPDISDNLFLNPSWYIGRYQELFGGLHDHMLGLALSSTTWGPISNGVFRYVKKGGQGGNNFTSPANASPTITDAIGVADDHDTIVLLDNTVYKEPELTIQRPIALIGFTTANATATGFDPDTGPMPKLHGSQAHRVIKVSPWGSSARGLVCLRNLVIQHGKVEDEPGAKHYRGGGGVAIDQVDQVLIENCAFSMNKTFWKMNVLDIFKKLSPTVQAFLENPPSFFPDEDRKSIMNQVPKLKSTKNFGLIGQAFGGGVNCLGSSAYILNNLFEENTAMGRGGAIGVAGYGWPIIEENKLHNNRATHGSGEGRPDGGAIGVEAAVPSKKSLWLCIDEMADELADWLNKKSILELGLLGQKWGSSEMSVMQEFLQDAKGQYWSSEKLRMAKERFSVIRNNSIMNNTADDDGGAVYFSVLANSYMSGNTIRQNATRRGAGGAVRSTMASNLILNNEKIEDNVAHDDNSPNEEQGGGGIACRNIELLISGQTVIRNNTVRGFAGGGLYFNSSDEGGQLKLFHVILWEVFGFRRSIVEVENQVIVTANETLFLPSLDDPGHTRPMPPNHHHARGGGAYILRAVVKRVPEIPELRVNVAGGKINNNRARREVGGAIVDVMERQVDFYLVDQIDTEEFNDDDYIGTVGYFKYP